MKSIKEKIAFLLCFVLLVSCLSISAFADEPQETAAFYIKDQQTGTVVPITESQIRAASKKTVTASSPWEPYPSYSASYTGTFYSLSSIFALAGINVNDSHGMLVLGSDSQATTFTKSDLSYLYIYDQSEVENYGYTVGAKGTYGTAISYGGMKEDWITNITTIEIAYDHCLHYPDTDCQHKCIYCGKEEHYRLTVPGISGREIYDCQYKIDSWVHAGNYWYYIDPDGYVHKGWLQKGNTWYYLDPDDGMMVTGYQIINGTPYCFDSSGAMGVGWVKDTTGASYEHKWYYASSSGRLMTGWLSLGGKWYYLDPYEYYMYEKWHTISGKTYFFNPNSGAMSTGWVFYSAWEGDAGSWYYFTSSGAMITGWQYIGGKWYFFNTGGRMAQSEWQGGYWLNANGSWTYPYRGSWHYDGYGWWFGDTSGWYAKNQTVRINDSSYVFDGNGYWRY